jgi:large subunit ribosomal protein L19
MQTDTLVRSIEKDLLKTDLPTLRVGDQVKVGVLIREGDKERVQPYQGTIIAQHRAGLNSTITVRKIFQGIGVERIFLIHSPRINFILLACDAPSFTICVNVLVSKLVFKSALFVKMRHNKSNRFQFHTVTLPLSRGKKTRTTRKDFLRR